MSSVPRNLCPIDAKYFRLYFCRDLARNPNRVNPQKPLDKSAKALLDEKPSSRALFTPAYGD